MITAFVFGDGIFIALNNGWLFSAYEVTANVFSDNACIAKVGFGIDIETVFVPAVNESLGLFERRLDVLLHFSEEGGLESAAQESITEIFHIASERASCPR